MNIFLPAACVAAVLLCGCQALPAERRAQTASATPTVQPVIHPVTRPALQMQQLWMEGNLRAGNPLQVTTIRADSDRVTLSWNGDAVELLSALARARGLVFSYAGVRLPLPVDIDVSGVTYANLIRLIEMQTAWRATLVTYPGQMVLQFMPAVPAAPHRNVQGDRR